MIGIHAELPDYMKAFVTPHRHNGLYGGRGSGKSWSIARLLVARVYAQKKRVLCAREYQNSIDESVHHLLEQSIVNMGLEDYFTITKTAIDCVFGGGFRFKGFARNTTSMKSFEDFDDCWVEEAQTLSQASMNILHPTIRKPGSCFWYTLNPTLEDDPVYKEFIVNPREDSLFLQVNYNDNPFFPSELEAERKLMLERDPALYRHVWEGECLKYTDAQVFKDKWQVEAFEPSPAWGFPLYGLDFGFSQDPTACVKVWVHDETLYIEKEAVKVKLELEDTADFIKARMPEIENEPLRADCARPESISLLNNPGRLPGIKACAKWKGCVEDGVSHMRSYRRIVLHPQCTETIKEFTLYSHKVDQRTGDVRRDIDDKHNHCIDAVRYALEPLIDRDFSILDAF